MKLINPSFKIIEQEPGIEGAWKMVEKAARVCYQSEQRNTDETSEQFCKRVLLKHNDKAKNHLRPLEFGTVYLHLKGYEEWENVFDFFRYNNWTKISHVIEEDSNSKMISNFYITTNLRVIYEWDLSSLLEYWCEPTPHHYRRIAIDWIIGRDIADEFRTHVSLSSTMESSRYCNYSKGKFDNNVTFMIPSCCTTEIALKALEPNKGQVISAEDKPLTDAEKLFYDAILSSEWYYFALLREGWKPEMARKVLAFDFKAEMMQCGFIEDWNRFFALRADGISGAPHPDSVYIATKAKKEFIQYAN